jgi:hypothetical protein
VVEVTLLSLEDIKELVRKEFQLLTANMRMTFSVNGAEKEILNLLKSLFKSS